MLKWDATPKIKNSCENKVIVFEKTLKFKNAIIFCYNRHKSMALQ